MGGNTCAAGALGGAVLLLAGCAVGPDFEPPAPPAGARYAARDLPDPGDQRFVRDRDIPGQWWSLFRSEPLDALIERALRANPDLKSAEAALRAAHENSEAATGALYPSLSASFLPSRQKNAGQLSPSLSGYASYYNFFSAQLSVTYVPDVFGGARRAVESVEAQEEAQRFEVEAAYLALTANLVATAIEEASLRAQIAATGEIIRIEAEALALLRKQFAEGRVAGGDVAAQEAALAQAEGTLPPLRQLLAQQRDLLAMLAGGFPGEEDGENFELASLQLPRDLPLSLPAKLVEQRPDIRAAEAMLHAAEAQIGVAIADRLPKIALTAIDGTTSTKLGQLFQPGNGFWTLSANLTQPLFDGFTLLHREREARARFVAAAEAYRSTVLTAFRNVADTLNALDNDANAVATGIAAAEAAEQSLAINRRQLEEGAVGALSLLNAQTAREQAALALIQARTRRLADTAALFQALGGGWWNRGGAEPERAAPPTGEKAGGNRA
jgi:NodT family efflux transporter outer membrane factor (OMF) lipoprotein